MNAALGSAGVTLGFAASVVGLITVVLGLTKHRSAFVRQSRVYALLVLVGAVLAFGAMQRALITRDYSVLYVAEHGSNSTPPLFNFATLWAALEGSIIL